MNFKNTIKTKRSLGILRKASKTKPKSPNATGQMKLQRHTISMIGRQLAESGEDEITCCIAGWLNTDHRGEYLTIELSPFYSSQQSMDRHNILAFMRDEQAEDEH